MLGLLLFVGTTLLKVTQSIIIETQKTVNVFAPKTIITLSFKANSNL